MLVLSQVFVFLSFSGTLALLFFRFVIKSFRDRNPSLEKINGHPTSFTVMFHPGIHGLGRIRSGRHRHDRGQCARQPRRQRGVSHRYICGHRHKWSNEDRDRRERRLCIPAIASRNLQSAGRSKRVQDSDACDYCVASTGSAAPTSTWLSVLCQKTSL